MNEEKKSVSIPAVNVFIGGSGSNSWGRVCDV